MGELETINKISLDLATLATPLIGISIAMLLGFALKDLITNSKRFVIKSEKVKELRNHITTLNDIKIVGFNNYHVVVDTDIDLHELVYKISKKHEITGVSKDLDITRLFN